MQAAEIREKFLRYFESLGHTIVPSSSLIPDNDPTLLFTNSGMVQFKEVFLGIDRRLYVRAVSTQRCVRAGGKHNDLENVGYTARHHTFFEMLGNFSFGDYFKRDAIHYAWRLLTEIYQLPVEKLWVTVYQDDQEAFDIWADQIKVPHDRIVRIGDNKGARYASDNFWQMAETGPCGPCSEIFYDHGAQVAGGPPGSAESDGDRFIEIWNLVFMQFNKDEAGNLHPLPKPCVDTGMGLERLAAVLQHVHSNYEIDLFQKLIQAAAQATHCADLTNNSLKVIADHLRASTFLILDGVIPSNEGRGYVLRRIIRRALRHGYTLGQTQPFFYTLVPALAQEMGRAYPELNTFSQHAAEVLQQEEKRFIETLEQGMKILEGELNKLAQDQPLPGAIIFLLYDTYGFPFDLTADICRERHVTLDDAGFDAAMQRQREQARAAGKFKAAHTFHYQDRATEFTGYADLTANTKILALYREGVAVDQINDHEEAVIVLQSTPFYAESGGQVGDSGELRGTNSVFQVSDTQKIKANVYGHFGVLKKGALHVGETIAATVDNVHRVNTVRNHSATHLMHKALREVLGTHVQQKGSLVDAAKTRFDFTHNAPLTFAQIQQVEALVNQEIVLNVASNVRVMPFDDAVKLGATALFGEKYDDQVRVLDIGTSRELCGGTHVQRTGDIGFFKIISETGIAAGVRRVEAVTGMNALGYIQDQEKQLNEASTLLKTQPRELPSRITQLQDTLRTLEKELSQMKSKLAKNHSDDLAAQAIEIRGVKVLAARIDHVDSALLREMVDKLKDRLLPAAVIVLATAQSAKVTLVAGVTADLTNRIKAGAAVNFIAQQVGGKGGGRADIAQAGGTQPENLEKALQSFPAWIDANLI